MTYLRNIKKKLKNGLIQVKVKVKIKVKVKVGGGVSTSILTSALFRRFKYQIHYISFFKHFIGYLLDILNFI
jgi:hypothetical protein